MKNTAIASRNKLYEILGDLPPRDRSISSETIDVSKMGGYICETLLLDLNGIEKVPAFFVKPKDATGRLPTVIFNHSHGGKYGLGKNELIAGNTYLQSPPYAQVLTQLGYNVLCIDAWCFGERNTATESATFKEMLWKGSSLWGMMVYDSLRAVDYLVSRDDVDAGRIGTLGMSMGSTMAWWLAALDSRIKVCIDICCLTEFNTLISKKGLDLHGVYYYVPGLLKHFTTAGINSLIAPRAHLSLAGVLDALTPPEGLDLIDQELRHVYQTAGTPQNWRLSRYNCAHQETEMMRVEVGEYFKLHL